MSLELYEEAVFIRPQGARRHRRYYDSETLETIREVDD